MNKPSLPFFYFSHFFRWVPSSLSFSSFIILFAILLVSCEKNNTPTTFHQRCETALATVDESATQLENFLTNHSKSVINDSSVNRDEFLVLINAVLTSLSNGMKYSNWMIERQYVYDSLVEIELLPNEEIAESLSDAELNPQKCKQLLFDKQQQFFSDEKVFRPLTELDVSSYPVSTQHFYNKLLARFRSFGANKTPEEKAKIISLRQSLVKNISDQQQCAISNVLKGDNNKSYSPLDEENVKSCISLANDYLDLNQQLSLVLGYPENTSSLLPMSLMNNTMALSGETATKFISVVSEALLESSKQEIKNSSEDQYLDYALFQAGVFDVITRLFDIEFIVREKNQDALPQADLVDVEVMQNGQVIGYLKLDTFYFSSSDNLEKHRKIEFKQFLPIKNGLSFSSSDNDLMENGTSASKQLPEAAILVSLFKTKDESNLRIHFNEANQFIFNLGQFVAHLMASQQSWDMNASAVIEGDAQAITGFVMQSWLMRDELQKYILTGLNNRQAQAFEEYRANQKQLDLKWLIVKANLRLWYLTELKSEKDIQVNELIAEQEKLLTKYRLHLNEIEKQHMLFDMLSCKTYCYEDLWSQMIAEELLIVINQWQALDEVVIKDFKNKWLLPGASRTAEDAASDFIGAPLMIDSDTLDEKEQAFFKYLSKDFSKKPF